MGLVIAVAGKTVGVMSVFTFSIWAGSEPRGNTARFSSVVQSMNFRKMKNCIRRFGKASRASIRRKIEGAASASRRLWKAVRAWKSRKAVRPPGRRRLVRFALAFILVAAGFGLFANRLVTKISEADIYRTVDAVPSRYTAIVLGARVYADHTPSPILEDRLRAGLDLYRHGKVQKILVSGDHAAAWYDEVNTMYKWLRGHGVKDRDIFLDHAGLRTLDSMARAATVFEVTEAVICTQAFHLARSLFLAKKAGIDAVGLVADRRRYRHHQANLAREFVARSLSVLDVYIFNRGPKFQGDKVPIHGDGRITHDARTTAASGELRRR